MDLNSTKNQDIKRAFVAREVGECVSVLVHELAQKAEQFPEYEDDLMDAFRGVPDYQEAAEAEGWKRATDGTFYQESESQFYLSVNLHERGQLNVSVHHVSEPGQGSNGKEVWAYVGTDDEAVNLDCSECLDITDPDELKEYLVGLEIMWADDELHEDEECGFTVSDASDWQELCQDEDIETDGYESEIFEHWTVSGFLARKLAKHGHRVLDDFFGLTIWGRPTSGQAILLDGVISDICEGMEILEGQRNEWKV